MDGCECVFHTASPMVTSYSLADPKKQLVDPAIEGTRNVIGEAIKSNSVSTVVLTSSISAITSHAKPEDYVFSEKDWNDDASIDDSPYSFGKTLAEKEAWKLVSGTKIRLVAINPSFIIGSSIGIHPESKSIAHPIEILDGSYYEKGAPSIEECTVDIRDVVEAHIRAFENPTASGRYLVSSEHSTTPLDWAKILASEPQFASYPLPTKLTKGKLKKTHLSSEKVQKELGIHFIPLEESLKEVAQFLIESGVVRTLKRQHHCCT
ncbi:hypothetical protein K7432_006702 [Basidiobolus ranarum]|uniref:3-beta hydroxysteroid dehydrogenase/isomerase domain-containing protein n=1 Tax=Basidiobolus ranarum TaxID=34480 RepID=A0ABR2W166_9FUNG